MEFDDIQLIWSEKSSHPLYAVDETAMEKIASAKRNRFRRTIFWRDFREIGAGIIVAVVFLITGFRAEAANPVPPFGGWPAFTLAAGGLFVTIFMIVARIRQTLRERAFDATSVLGNLSRLRSNLDHQIRLLSNVLWWYLLPLVPGFLFFDVATFVETGKVPVNSLLIFVGLFSFVLWLNWSCVKTSLKPQREEVDGFIRKLKEELEP